MLDEIKRKLRRIMRPKPPPKKRREVRIPEEPQPGGPERAQEAQSVRPPEGEPAAPEKTQKEESYAVPVNPKKELHDGYADIRPRRPGEETDMGRDIVPDITIPGRDLLPPEDDEDPRRKSN